jgi:hypothetical protein
LQTIGEIEKEGMQSIVVCKSGSIIIVVVMNFVYEGGFNWSIQYDDCCDESTDGKEK